MVLVAAFLASGAIGHPAAAGRRLAHVPVGGVTRPPVGWVGFCARQPDKCGGTPLAARDPALPAGAWKHLVRVNKWANKAIKPLTDLEHWGQIEVWSFPEDGYGDCEDYVLLKRRMLMSRGWPRDALLVTVVRDKNGDGHAVLLVATNKGDYVLDNQNDKILLWSDTGYSFVKRQSRSDPNIWVSLGDRRPAVATASR
jgi:predicted transglutaminase-like cysteine proteinase